MADQYGLTSEDYVNNLKSLSNTRYGEGISILILSFSAEVFLSHYCYFDGI